MKICERILDKCDEAKGKFKLPKFKKLKKLLKKFKKAKQPKKPKVAFNTKAAKKKQGKSFWKKFFETLNEEYSKKEIDALAKHLGIKADEIEDNGWALEANGGEYEIMTDSDASSKLSDYIEDSLAYFNHDFLINYIDDDRMIEYYNLDSSYYDEDEEKEVEIGDEEEVIYLNMGMSKSEKIKELQDEDNSEEILKLLGDKFSRLVKDAEMSDGRGHFLSGYDGEEIELDGDLYAYRTN